MMRSEGANSVDKLVLIRRIQLGFSCILPDCPCVVIDKNNFYYKITGTSYVFLAHYITKIKIILKTNGRHL